MTEIVSACFVPIIMVSGDVQFQAERLLEANETTFIIVQFSVALSRQNNRKRRLKFWNSVAVFEEHKKWRDVAMILKNKKKKT